MSVEKAEGTIAEQAIVDQIYTIRDQKVMIDRDLAVLYGVKTKVLKQAVKRNSQRFPLDFMFEMTKEELSIWRSQIVTSKSEQMGLRHLPYCFTEQGVAMLSSVLNSDRAIAANIRIIRIFTRLRTAILGHAELRIEVEQIKKKLLNHDKNIELVFQYLDELLLKNQESQPRKQIGFRIGV